MHATPSCFKRSLIVLTVLSCVWYLDEGVFSATAQGFTLLRPPQYLTTLARSGEIRHYFAPAASIARVVGNRQVLTMLPAKTSRSPHSGQLAPMAQAD
jgi:hypothetical protein